jgi:hypothetical protein
VNSFTLETRVVRNTTSVAANQRPANRRFNQTSAYPRFEPGFWAQFPPSIASLEYEQHARYRGEVMLGNIHTVLLAPVRRIGHSFYIRGIVALLKFSRDSRCAHR